MKKAGSVSLGSALIVAAVCAAPPIRLHPDNPRWFGWRGKATALITSAEHYGALLNKVPEWRKPNTLPPGTSPEKARAASPTFAVQESLTRWLVCELNGFDNFFFEIQNEPWADNRLPGELINPYLLDRQKWPNAVEIPTAETVAWQRAMARIIADEESRLPNRHLSAQNVANFRLALNDGDLVPEASIVNFHYAYREAAEWDRGLNRAIGCDETGFAGKDDAHYRRQAWRFMLSGGALLNNLDYSFTVGHEDSNDTTNQAPGGGSPALRRQLEVLSSFLHRFDLARLHPDPAYFDRLRQRVRAAQERGIYVGIMLFEGWGLQHLPNAWASHPFHPSNNIQGLDGDAGGDGRGLVTHTLKQLAVTRLQEAYVRQAIDAVNDLDNVLYEIINESGLPA